MLKNEVLRRHSIYYKKVLEATRTYTSHWTILRTKSRQHEKDIRKESYRKVKELISAITHLIKYNKVEIKWTKVP